MTACIALKSGNDFAIKGITKIKEVNGSGVSIKEYTDFSNFSPYDYNYIFIGDDIATVYGADILYVLFMKD